MASRNNNSHIQVSDGPVDLWSNILKCVIHEPGNVFENFMKSFDDHYASQRPTSITGLKKRAGGNLEKGLEFEKMVAALLRQGELLSNWQPHDVYRYGDLSDEQKRELGFVKGDRVVHADMGIDIVAKDRRGWWHALQVKYVKKPRTTNRYQPWQVDHERLNTFRGYVYATGPAIVAPLSLQDPSPSRWRTHIVVTNAIGVKHIVNRTTKDQTIAHGTFCAVPLESWKAILGDIGNVLVSKDTISVDSLFTNILEKPAYFTTSSPTTGTSLMGSSMKIPKNRKVNTKTLRAARSDLLDKLTSTSTTKEVIKPNDRQPPMPTVYKAVEEMTFVERVTIPIKISTTRVELREARGKLLDSIPHIKTE